MALVGGANGNTTPEAQAFLDALAGGPAASVAEGVVTFGVVRESTAREHGLPVQARLVGPEIAAAAGRTGACAASAGYLGAGGALALLRDLAGADVPAAAEPAPRHPVEPELLDATRDAEGRPTGVRRHVVDRLAAPLESVRPSSRSSGPAPSSSPTRRIWWRMSRSRPARSSSAPVARTPDRDAVEAGSHPRRPRA